MRPTEVSVMDGHASFWPLADIPITVTNVCSRDAYERQRLLFGR